MLVILVFLVITDVKPKNHKVYIVAMIFERVMKQNYEYIDLNAIPEDSEHETTVKMNKKEFFTLQKKLASEDKTFKEFVNESIKNKLKE